MTRHARITPFIPLIVIHVEAKNSQRTVHRVEHSGLPVLETVQKVSERGFFHDAVISVLGVQVFRYFSLPFARLASVSAREVSQPRCIVSGGKKKKKTFRR